MTTVDHEATKPEESREKPRDGRVIGLTILEVLGGLKSPPEAAESLDVSLTYYYVLEAKAIEGLLLACEPKPKGPRSSPEKQVEELRRDKERLERELLRTQAIARAAQRSLEQEIAKHPKPKKASASNRTKKVGKRRKQRTVRALRAVDRLKNDPPAQRE